MKAEFDTPKAASTNRARHVDCRTCDGDRFVVVYTRPVKQVPWKRRGGWEPREFEVEEYAPCPDCNAECNTTFHRANGQRVETPAQVRELMRR